MLRDGAVRRTLFCLHMIGVELLAPRELIEELLEHIDEVARRMGMDRNQVFSILKENILSKVKLCDASEYKEHLSSAMKICAKFDIEDSPFIALALKYNSPIWSNDPDLKNKQKEVVVLTTKEITEMIRKRNIR